MGMGGQNQFQSRRRVSLKVSIHGGVLTLLRKLVLRHFVWLPFNLPSFAIGRLGVDDDGHGRYSAAGAGYMHPIQ